MGEIITGKRQSMFFEEKNWPSVLVGHPSRLKLLFNLSIPSNIIFLGQCIPAIFLHRIPETFNGCKIVNFYIYITYLLWRPIQTRYVNDNGVGRRVIPVEIIIII